MKQWLKDLFNPAGPVSFGRVMAMLMTAFVLGWDTSYTVHYHAVMGGAELLLQAGFCTTFYAITKAVELKNPPNGN